jgi:glycosyltransferase involved in cell wall biosynthesis
MKKIGIIGTNGLPSNYGGFETLVEYLVENLATKYSITVYCSKKNRNSFVSAFKGCQLEYVNLSANGWQSIIYDIVSLLSALKDSDKILILGASGSIILPFLSKSKEKFIMNLGGLDWQRSKWNYLTRKYIKFCERLAVKHSSIVISDNIGIKKYLLAEYKSNSTLIAYGGDQVFSVIPNGGDRNKYPFMKGQYDFTVTRIQRDNNLEILLESYANGTKYPIVIVGNWDFDSYGFRLKEKYNDNSNIFLLDAIYEPKELNLLRANCRVYLHGNSAGGTNPALVEAMNLGLPVFAYDCNFNRYTTYQMAKYFSSSRELKKILNETDVDELSEIGIRMDELARSHYTWTKIATKYGEIFNL